VALEETGAGTGPVRPTRAPSDVTR
jgi:hypothetical protein